LHEKGNDDDNDDDDDDEDTDEENDDKDDDKDDDKCNDSTDTNDDYEDLAFLKNDMMCLLQDKAGILGSWILLDSQSTAVDVFSNKKLLTNIRDSKMDSYPVLQCQKGNYHSER